MITKQTLKNGKFAVLTTRKANYTDIVFGKVTVYKSKESYDNNNVLVDGFETITNIHLGLETELKTNAQKFLDNLV